MQKNWNLKNRIRMKVGGKFKLGNLDPSDRNKIIKKLAKKGNIPESMTKADLCDIHFGKGNWKELKEGEKMAKKVVKEAKKAKKVLEKKAKKKVAKKKKMKKKKVKKDDSN